MTAGGMKGSGRWAGYTSKGRSGDNDEYRALTMELLDKSDRVAADDCTPSSSQELEMMGGGDTRIGKHTVVVRLRPPRHGSGYGAVWAEGNKIHVADSKEKGARVGSRVYNVSAALPAFATQRDLYNAVGVGALDTLWDGFNSSIIAMGQVGTGKTHCLFGSPISADGEDLCTQLLSTLFSRIRQSQTPQDFSVLISMWDIVTDANSGLTDVMDLLRDPSDSLPSHAENSLACVAIESLSDALQAIEVGRSRSENWTQDPVKGTYAALPNRAHAFVRVTLYDARRRRVSAFHLVDLIGSCPLAGAKSSDNAFTQRPGSDRLRRAHSQQIISLNRIISDLASKHEKKGVAVSMSPAELKVGAYKDSKLNKFIAPLIAGNNQTTILTTVSTDADDLLDSLNTLRCTSRALSISTACHRRLNVAPGEIASEPLSHLLAVSHAGGQATTLDPRKSPTLSPQKLAPHTGPPHERQARMQEEVRKARSNMVHHQQYQHQQLLHGRGGNRGHEAESQQLWSPVRESSPAGRPTYQEEAQRRRERVHFDDRTRGGSGATGGRYAGAGDAEFDMASHEVSEIEHYIRGRGGGDGGSRGGGSQSLSTKEVRGSQGRRAGAKELFLESPVKSQFLRAGEEEAYEMGGGEEEETFEASPPSVSGGGYDGSVPGGNSLRDEFREVMEEMEQHSSGMHGARNSGGGSGREEEEAMDEMDLQYESMLRQLEHTQVKATGPGGHFTAQRAEMHKAAAPSRSPASATPPSGGRGVGKLSKDIGEKDLEELVAEYELQIASQRQEILELKRKLRHNARPDDADQDSSGLLLAENEAEIARLNAALAHARQVQAATEAAVEEELAGAGGEGNVAGSERARAVRELQRKNLMRAHKEIEKISKENEALRKEKRQFVKQKQFLQNLSQRAAALTLAMTKKEKESLDERSRLAEAHERNTRLEAALHDANIKERRLKDELEPLRDDLCRLQEVNRDLVKQRRNARLFQKTDFTGAGNNGEKKTRGNGLDMLKRLENELGSHKGAVLPLLQGLRAELEAYEEEFGRFTSREQEMLGALVDKHDKSKNASASSRRETHGTGGASGAATGGRKMTS